jgi:DGQHR domain-containing protein
VITIASIQDLQGEELENWFKDLLKDKLKLGEFYPRSGQIELNQLIPGSPRGHHLEIDGVLLIKQTAILMEFTGEKTGLRNKIKKFTRHCNLFLSSEKPLGEKFGLFQSIPSEKIPDFEEVTDWRFVFFGTSDEIEKNNLRPQDFLDYPRVRDLLRIFGIRNIEYISQLTNLINQYAKYEFLSSLNFSPEYLGENQLLEKKFLCLENKFVTESNDIRADIYLLKFNVKELLKIGRVSRYEGIPFALETEDKGQYQRFLVENKLSNIANNFLKNNRRKAFPNTITIVLSNECRIDETREDILLIPNRYSSVDIIDGQHRIFAYADSSISQEVIEHSCILASAIKFRTTDSNESTRLAAKIFCEINSKQAKVKNSLLYLIKFDVLGDLDPIALAGKVVLECNKGNSALGDIFLTNSLVKKNKFSMKPIPIVTIVDQDLNSFMNGEGVDCELESTEFTNIFGHTKEHLLRNPEVWWRKGKNILEQYFNSIRRTFPHDWKNNSDSLILSAKYISAFIRLLAHYLIDEDVPLSEMSIKLADLKTGVDNITSPAANQASFPKGNDNIPSTKFGINKIYEFLDDPGNWTP